MALVARLIGLFIAAIGVLGVIAPDDLLTAVRSLQTPLGLYLAAS